MNSQAAEALALWYFRLNGFLTIPNYVLHPDGRGSQRTDADLVGVRFRDRQEGGPGWAMPDDAVWACDSGLQVAIVEVKSGGCCKLNGPWTRRDYGNVDRLLTAVGCIPRDVEQSVSTALYDCGEFRDVAVRVVLVAVAEERSDQLLVASPGAIQLIHRDWQHSSWIDSKVTISGSGITPVGRWRVRSRGERSGTHATTSICSWSATRRNSITLTDEGWHRE